MKLLIVDDDQTMLDTLSRAFVLHAPDIDVITTTKPTSVLETITKERIDVVLTDIMMPELNGIDLIKQIKARNGMIQIIAMTGQTKLEYVTAALRRGATEIFLKPFKEVKEVIDCVKEIETKISRWKRIILDITSKK